MKLVDWIILFVLMTIPVNCMVGYRMTGMQMAMEKSIEMNKILDRSIEDGTRQMALGMAPEKAVAAFFESMQVNLDLSEDPIAQQRLKSYIPAILLIDRDGFYIWGQQDYVDAAGYHYRMAGISEKQCFAASDDQYIYGFALDGLVKVYDRSSHRRYEGTAADLGQMLPDSIFSDEAAVERMSRQAVTKALTRALERQINSHNRYAAELGVYYGFSLPQTDQADFANAVDDVGMLVFFQGMPLGIGDKVYNRFAFAGAGVIKREMLYLQQEASGPVYYHRKDCMALKLKDRGYSSAEECALAGAFPCDSCRP